jgi:hypothetical protein
VAPRVEKLWRYTTLARTWSWSLIGVAGALLVVGIGLQAGSEDGLTARWLGIALGVSGLTGIVFFPLLRVWLRRSGLPSVRLPSATREPGTPRRLEAAPADWRRWTALTAGLLLVGGAAMLTFLIGVLGRGGTAEGVVVGVLTAWGLATLEDSRRIERTEAEEGRRYYAAGARPTGAGGKLVWVTAKEAQRA